MLNQINFKFILETEDPIDLEKLRLELCDILKQTADYRRDNISCYHSLYTDELIIDIWPKDFVALQHSKKSLKEAFDYMINKAT